MPACGIAARLLLLAGTAGRPRRSRASVFGLDYYKAPSTVKIVLNGAIDMACADCGNMRCFEALGSEALLLSDEGNCPDGETIATYKSAENVVEQVKRFLQAPVERLGLSPAGMKWCRPVTPRKCSGSVLGRWWLRFRS